MTLANFKVVGVVSRRYLNAARSKLLIHVFICNNRNLAVRKGKYQLFSDKVLISFVLRVYRNCRISQHSFRSCGSYLYKTAFLPHDGVVDVPEKAILILMLHLGIGNRSLAFGAPVYYLRTLVYPAFFIKIKKCLLYRFRTAFIHGKALSVPVCGGAQLMKLIYDTATVLFSPFPAVFKEFFPSYLVFIYTLCLQAFRNLYLCGNGRMIGARLPQCLVSFHPLPTGQDILKCIIQGMSHMQLPRDIWRRHNYRKGFLFFIRLCVEISAIKPFLVNAILHSGGIIGFSQFLCHFDFLLHPFLLNVRCNRTCII